MGVLLIENATARRNEVLRYAGYRGQVLSTQMQRTVDRVIAQTERLVRPRLVYRMFTLERSEKDYYLKEAQFPLKGEKINIHLDGCSKAILMAATLGEEMDRKIRTSQVLSPSEAILYDSCASEMIERVCNLGEERIALLEHLDKSRFTTRFSPGYGDFPLNEQKALLKILDTSRRIGLFVSTGDVLTPMKSVTAIIGIGCKNQQKRLSCVVCEKRKDCSFQKISK